MSTFSIYDYLLKAAPGWNPDTPPVEPDPSTREALGEALLRRAEASGLVWNGEPCLDSALIAEAVRDVASLGGPEFDSLFAWAVATLMTCRFIKEGGDQ